MVSLLQHQASLSCCENGLFISTPGQSLEGPRPAKPVVTVSQEEKDAYTAEAKAFANDLADQLQDHEGRYSSFSETIYPCLLHNVDSFVIHTSKVANELQDNRGKFVFVMV